MEQVYNDKVTQVNQTTQALKMAALYPLCLLNNHYNPIASYYR